VNKIFTVQDLGGWSKVDKQFFADGGIFDKVQAAIKR
jgi:sulfate/thiosulfate transport system substrate-binding protein